MTEKPLLIILGATASGKTKLAVQLAKTLNAEIISADSRQVFKDMDIGTGKDLSEYEEANTPFHLINIRAAGENYNVNAFKDDFYKAFESISHRCKLPILCGGTGMYIHSILQNHEFTAVPVNENLRARLAALTKTELQHTTTNYPSSLISHADFSSTKRLIRAIEVAEYLQNNELPKIERPDIDFLVIGLVDTVENRREKIRKRLEDRLNEGLITEVESLLKKGISAQVLTSYGLEYKFVTAYLTNQIDYNTLKERLTTAIFQYAKRQQTFFRKMEKDGIKINWLDAGEDITMLKTQALQLIETRFHFKNRR
ncbi:MAG: tRNA (adenosine(37)-N6)-dimethylallyltransferase MiaA [Bacteroidota bacterium]